ncbi:MAG: cytochrome c [Meiothermus sp.]|uniref:c-type cytochrome n=1 Tax=Meiothermus sp. TaxID=1955249 RepID=UPI00298F2F79|nr:cytochrome c [Meiothermus sp.]MCX7740306.1 cytochrome c [Meiothermus sp.]MDW8480433.1 cytochrome c [Meiothermus sp.]
MKKAAVLLALGLLALPAGLQAQQATTPQAQQLALGSQVYQAQCATCHAQGAQGLVGSAPLSRLTRYRTAQGLYDYVTLSMPPTNPGGLKDEEYWAVIAYILSENKVLPAGTVVGPNNARQLPIRLPSN